MKTVNAAIVPNSWASYELSGRRSMFDGAALTGMLKRNERRKSRHALNAELASRSLDDIREDFQLLKMPAPKARTFLELKIPQFLLENVPAPTRFKEVTVVRKRVSQRRPSVETLRIPAGW
ncbi:MULTISPECIES: hypothetical protein [unclassified Variovorax]|uniref:hypothetical protein n=1 Tax=unclassified Variovorax TaxID=663243 RepID=UPI0013177785|nr:MULTISPECIES: hypothetical protein [unclassified Variovorax]VTU42961.1 hypothetical protein SRS16P1_00402 [Variovorax sp. SRS16]VTU42992.1 hypothetical protein E5P1_00400 [Variovorax sp. PBL-E5]VTU43553.1 hypothetical protein H6P1_00504 [Variovorax sp. PBL-H6]